MRLLLHICCAPCAIGALEGLRAERHDVTGFFYNPNIHPFLEFRKRIKALKVFCESDPVPVIFHEAYGLELFVQEIYRPRRSERCAACYEERLRRTARLAREKGFDGFTTTLLVSPHQAHDVIRRTGERIGAETGTAFLYRDLRPHHGAAQEQARRRRIYRQPYCGCCFSEYERYRDTTRELYRGGPPAPRTGKGA